MSRPGSDPPPIKTGGAMRVSRRMADMAIRRIMFEWLAINGMHDVAAVKKTCVMMKCLASARQAHNASDLLLSQDRTR